MSRQHEANSLVFEGDWLILSVDDQVYRGHRYLIVWLKQLRQNARFIILRHLAMGFIGHF